MGSRAFDSNFEVHAVPDEPLVVMRRFISKITQLITLCSKVNLNLDNSFAAGLAMESQRYESWLFRFLIDRYEHPIAALDVFKQAFPLYVGDSLEKSLRIFQETKDKSNN
jgi:hypothetical protein